MTISLEMSVNILEDIILTGLEVFNLFLETMHLEPFFFYFHKWHRGQPVDSVSSQVHFLPLLTPSPPITKDYMACINSFA